MSISFNSLCEYFKGKANAVYNGINQDIYFDDAELITDNTKEYYSKYIYVGKVSNIKEKMHEICNCCFILINDDSTLLKDNLKSNLKIIEVNKNENMFEIYNEVRTIFRRNQKYNELKMALLEALVLGANLDEMINIASKSIGNPLIVIDLSFKVLAHSSIENITDFLWKDNVQRGYCSYEFIAGLTKLKNIKEGKKANLPYEVTCPESPNKKVVYRIEIEDKIVGNILLIECNKKVDKNDYDKLMLVSEIISKKLEKKHFFKNTRSVLTEEVLYDLLENNLDKAIMQEILKNVSLAFSSNMSILAVDISNYALKHSVYTRYLNLTLSQFFPVSKSVYYNGNIVIVIGNDQSIRDKSKIQEFKKFLLENNLKMGISSEFYSIEDCSIYYKQAIRSLEIGKILNPEECVFKFQDIQPYNFIYMAKDEILKEDFYNNSLYMLKRFDDKNSSELYKTLYVYLKNNHNVTKTAEELFIHRNTLRYRIEKIFEIIGLDLDEDDNSFKLYYAFISMKFYKKLSNPLL